jgi:hypothetical protein
MHRERQAPKVDFLSIINLTCGTAALGDRNTLSAPHFSTELIADKARVLCVKEAFGMILFTQVSCNRDP